MVLSLWLSLTRRAVILVTLYIFLEEELASKNEAPKLAITFFSSVPQLEYMRESFLTSDAMKDYVTKTCIAVFTHLLLCYECNTPQELSLSWTLGQKRIDVKKKRNIAIKDQWNLKKNIELAGSVLLEEAKKKDAILALSERKRLFDQLGGFNWYLSAAEFVNIYAPPKPEPSGSSPFRI